MFISQGASKAVQNVATGPPLPHSLSGNKQDPITVGDTTPKAFMVRYFFLPFYIFFSFDFSVPLFYFISSLFSIFVFS
jgi:hypothetical protein